MAMAHSHTRKRWRSIISPSSPVATHLHLLPIFIRYFLRLTLCTEQEKYCYKMFRPFGLPSENRTAEWHPEPTTRGTFSLVSTCLITMGLCIWTAVHLNIPGPGERVTQFWRKVFCVLIGLFAPELVSPSIRRSTTADERRLRGPPTNSTKLHN